MRAREISHFRRICTLAVKLRFHERLLLSEEEFRKLLARSVLTTNGGGRGIRGANPILICDWQLSHLFGWVLGEMYRIGITDVTDTNLRYATRRATVPELSSLMYAWDVIRRTETC